MEALEKLFGALPRQAPGSEASTLRAIRRLPPPRAGARILDVGCGKGRQTIQLARHYKAPVTAVDVNANYLRELELSAQEAGLSKLIQTRRASMEQLDYSANSFDVIWCEGAIYHLGVTKALTQWSPMLRYRGAIAFTELSWLKDDIPHEAKLYWARHHQEMTTVNMNRRKGEAAGFEVIDHFPLPAADWWTEYYTPLEARIAELKPEAEKSPELAAAIAEAEKEVELCRKHGETYGYVFYLLRRLS
ncbi:MAG: class I SAM-dependent methyltransferase [Bryobacteraceae bacterium]|nr:class I SAM-dependent methyltransferase [Bryobacteraceae bacterium]